jgi:hypothetical protein
MPVLSFRLPGSLGAGENRSCTLSQGFGSSFVELTGACECAAFSDNLSHGFGSSFVELTGACEYAAFSGNLDFAWCCLASSNSLAGKTGYSRLSEGAG